MPCTELNSCIDSTTIHGLIHIAKGKTVILRIIWIIALTLSSIAFGYYAFNSVEKYLREESTVSLALRGAPFSPPDLHFCNANPLAKSRLVDYPSKKRTLSMKSLIDDVKFVESTNVPSKDKADYFYFWSSMDHSKLFRTAGPLLNQTIISPSSLNSEWSNKYVEVTPNHHYFSCIRYTGLRDKDFTGTFGSLVLLFYTDSYHLTESNITYNERPLDDMWYVMSDGPFRPTGIYMFVTPHGGYPHVESHSVFISPGHHTTVKLKMKKSLSVNVKHHPCDSKGRQVKYYNRLLGGRTSTTYNSSLSDCKYRKVLENLLKDKECQCIPFMAPVPLDLAEKYPTCANITRQKSNVSIALITKQHNCIAKYYELDERFNMNQCDSERPCENLHYYSEVSKAELFVNDTVEYIRNLAEKDPNFHYLGPGVHDYFVRIEEDSNREEIRQLTSRNFAVAVIREGETKSLFVKESIAYELSNLIADIGGLAGLFLGVSFLTTLEVVNLLHDVIYGQVHKSVH